jgi:hypothetical protein
LFSGHVGTLVAARQHLESVEKMKVVAGYLCPSSDNYVRSKLKGQAIYLAHRVELCNLASCATDFVCCFISVFSVRPAFPDLRLSFPFFLQIECCPWGYASARASMDRMNIELKKLYPEIEKRLSILEVCGADHVLSYQLWKREQSVVCVGRKGCDILSAIKKSKPKQLSVKRSATNANQGLFVYIPEDQFASVSSSAIRKALSSSTPDSLKELASKHWVDQASIDYILRYKNNHLFMS